MESTVILIIHLRPKEKKRHIKACSLTAVFLIKSNSKSGISLFYVTVELRHESVIKTQNNNIIREGEIMKTFIFFALCSVKHLTHLHTTKKMRTPFIKPYNRTVCRYLFTEDLSLCPHKKKYMQTMLFLIDS